MYFEYGRLIITGDDLEELHEELRLRFEPRDEIDDTELILYELYQQIKGHRQSWDNNRKKGGNSKLGIVRSSEKIAGGLNAK